MTSTDASIVPEPDDLQNDDEFMNELMEALEAGETDAAPAKEKDHVMVYHDMIRRAMADWGDDIIDALIKKFSKIPKVVAHIQAVRKDMIDPLRKHLE